MTADPRRLRDGGDPPGRADAKRADRNPGGAWLKLGLAAAIGLVAGTTLFATEAQGRQEARRRLGPRG